MLNNNPLLFWGEDNGNPLLFSVIVGVEGEQGGLFTFMRQTKKMRHQPDKEGIYLDDLNLDEMDPEIAALYLYTPKG